MHRRHFLRMSTQNCDEGAGHRVQPVFRGFANWLRSAGEVFLRSSGTPEDCVSRRVHFGVLWMDHQLEAGDQPGPCVS